MSIYLFWWTFNSYSLSSFRFSSFLVVSLGSEFPVFSFGFSFGSVGVSWALWPCQAIGVEGMLSMWLSFWTWSQALLTPEPCPLFLWPCRSWFWVWIDRILSCLILFSLLDWIYLLKPLNSAVFCSHSDCAMHGPDAWMDEISDRLKAKLTIFLALFSVSYTIFLERRWIVSFVLMCACKILIFSCL